MFVFTVTQEHAVVTIPVPNQKFMLKWDMQSFYGGGGGGGYAGALPGGAFGRRRNLFQYGGLSDILGSSCEKVSSVDIPKPDLSFTCGIDVKGDSAHSTCA